MPFVSTELSHQRPLRLWPGVVIVAAQWIARFGVPFIAPEFTMYSVMAGLAGGVAIVVWWLFFSRAPWSERLGAIAVIVVALLITWRLVRRVDCDGGNGRHATDPGHPWTVTGPRRLGGGQPSLRAWAAACDDGRRHCPRLRCVDAGPHRRV